MTLGARLQIPGRCPTDWNSATQPLVGSGCAFLLFFRGLYAFVLLHTAAASRSGCLALTGDLVAGCGDGNRRPRACRAGPSDGHGRPSDAERDRRDRRILPADAGGGGSASRCTRTRERLPRSRRLQGRADGQEGRPSVRHRPAAVQDRGRSGGSAAYRRRAAVRATTTTATRPRARPVRLLPAQNISEQSTSTNALQSQAASARKRT